MWAYLQTGDVIQKEDQILYGVDPFRKNNKADWMPVPSDKVGTAHNNLNFYLVRRQGVIISANFVALSELRADVEAARRKGFSGKLTFTPETVEALLDLIVDKK